MEETEGEWERIQSEQPSHAFPKQCQSQSREWEMVTEEEDEDNHDDEDISIFPPSNHEGLHISSHQPPLLDHHLHHVEQSHTTPPPPPPPRFDSQQLQIAKHILIKKLKLGFQIISSKFFSTSIYVTKRANMSHLSVAGIGVAFVVSLWYLKWRRKPSSPDEKIERLIGLVRHQDEKINHLLDQFSRLNESLSTRRRIPILRST